MTTPARHIEEFIPRQEAADSETAQRPEDPKFVGHLLKMPLTNGEEALVDPEEIISVSAHRTATNVTVVRQRNDNFTYFIDRHYTIVEQWIARALA